MAGLKDWKRAEVGRPSARVIRSHELRAVSSPEIPLRQLATQAEPQSAGGNFQDLEDLIDHLGSPPVFELGKPLPSDKYLPHRGLSHCPAAHNRTLLDEEVG